MNKFTLYALLNCFLIFSQKTAINEKIEGDYIKAIQLFDTKVYSGTQKILSEVSNKLPYQNNLKVNADYYATISSVKLNQPGAEEKVLKFIKENPDSEKAQKICLSLGDYFFTNRKAAHALKWYSKVNEKELPGDIRNEFNFKMAYSFLVTKNLSDAKEKFATLLGSPKYGNDARYYYGYISYRQENFDDATSNFSELANDATYQSKANYYLLDIAFKNGDFQQAITIGEKLLPNPEKGKKSEIVKMIGESYFNIGEYEKSIPYLLDYKGIKGKWNHTDLYYVGYAYYQKKDYQNAEKYFTKIISGNNTIAQNAYYHLGECYLELDKKNQALNAFKNASEMHFDKDIASDALLNYTKLSYEEGNPYMSSADILKNFIEKHPETEDAKQIEELLVTSYLHESKYQDAIDYLKSKQNFNNNELAKEISLYRGIQLLSEKKNKKSLPHLLNAKKSKNDTINNLSKFWLGEANYQLKKYNISTNEFLSVNKEIKLPELENIDYNIGYSLFKEQKFTESERYFSSFLNNNPQDIELENDAISRQGDCYYAQKMYEKAIEKYNLIIENEAPGSDYAAYQKAMSFGLLGEKKEKIKVLKKLKANYKNSDFGDDALYQIAKTKTKLKENKEAQTYYNKLLEQYPESSYTATTMLNKGLLYYSENDFENALLQFKEVTKKFPNSPEANQAVTNARNVYIEIGDIDSYVSWVNTLSFVNITNREIDDSSFYALENVFFDQDYMTAITGLISYIEKFPEGVHVLKANYYLAESYMNTPIKNEKNAIKHYKYVCNQDKNEFTEDSSIKLATILLENESWDDAISILEKLEKSANKQEFILFAQANLMKGYYKKGAHEKAKDYANLVLNSAKLDQTLKEEALLTIARYAIENNDFETAREYYEIINETATNEIKAETLYYKAMFLNEDKLYEESNIEIQSLIENYASYKYWGVKSYIIMAKNYYALKDAYQATYILENIIENFKEFDDLIEEAKNYLLKIKSEESKTNESINSKQ